MVAKTTKTVRATEIPLTVTREEFAALATRLSASLRRRGAHSSSASTKEWTPPISLCIQATLQVGTITLPSSKHRQAALVSRELGWKFDDTFEGVTVLHRPTSPDLDICAIHGLNENAFETWSSGNLMWLRDLLPQTQPFQNSRIMTFGYSPEKSYRDTIRGLKGWADELLRHLCSVRASDEEKKRSLLIIGHSIGGLIAREAIIQLKNYPQAFENNSITTSAVLFLSTPQSGSTEASWNKFLLDITELSYGVRSNSVTSLLRLYNPQLPSNCEEFESVSSKLAFHCLYENQGTSIRGLNRQIITQMSASFGNVSAVSVPEADHRSICKVNSKFSGVYRTMVKHLTALRAELEGQNIRSISPKPQTGRPPPTAQRYPNPAGRAFYAGKGLRPANRVAKLRGRQMEHEYLGNLISQCQEYSGAVAITGIGGIGKTEMLLDVAYQRLDRINIFFLRASNKEMLQEAYLHVAMHIGPEVLLRKYQGRDTRDIWSRMPAEERIEMFKDWLSQPENSETLVMLDDLDGLADPEDILSAIPQGAKTVVFSTRSPTLREEVDRECRHLRLWSMQTDDIIDIMEATVRQSDYEQDGELYNREVLRAIAKAVHGHPLAASHAIRYIIRVISQEPVDSPAQTFLSILENPEYETRASFLEYKPHAPSIMDTFYVSRNRLPNPDSLAWTLMQFLSILETDTALVDYRDFFYKRQCVVDALEFPNHELLSNCGPKLSEAFADLEAVSFGERLHTSKPFRFHPLWLECARHAMGQEMRLRAVRQVLLISHRTIDGAMREEVRERALKSFLPHIRHCVVVCENFGIELSHFSGPEDTLMWYRKGEKPVY
ncbi:hypothetical protein BKA65DRAFT_521106 [Rhexocercosporidium sp. MPI-PUGE-AT-0058]|nr:hypothetical protein BKA65DRAFT_521106 [Rhexocercosporidium sp. MPI-PUGE-AT-0058]